MPFYEDKRCQEAALLMDSVLKDVNDVSSLQLDSVDHLADKLNSFSSEEDKAAGNTVGALEIRQAILDGINGFEKQHGCKPGAHIVASAIEQAKVYLDDALSESSHSEPRAMVQSQALIAIKTMLFTAVPFAYYLGGDKQTGEAPLIIISHHAANKVGMYDNGSSLNGLSGGNPYITTDRLHTLTSSDKTTYTGKITAVMTDFEHCEQSAKVVPLYAGRTQILVNGLVVATTAKSNSDTEMVSTAVKIGETEYSFTATVKIKTGEVSVKFTSAVPENTAVAARGYLDVEDGEFADVTPSVKTMAKKFTLFAKNYRSKVVVTPEAALQFNTEMGIDPAVEGTMTLRSQFAQEHLYKILNEATTIAKYHHATEFDFDWDEAGKRKSQEEIAKILISKIDMVSQEMANRNGSHGISHIYVDDRIRTILSALGTDYFESSTEGSVSNVTALQYQAAVKQLKDTESNFVYLASLGSNSTALCAALAQLAFDKNIQVMIDVPNHLTPKQAIAWVNQLGLSSHLLSLLWHPVECNDPSGVSGRVKIGTSGYRCALSCQRNASVNALGFAAKQYAVAGRQFPVQRQGMKQLYKPDDEELSDLAAAGITPVIFQTFSGGSSYVFADAITKAGKETSFLNLISSVEIITALERDASRIAREFLLFMPMEEAIKTAIRTISQHFDGAKSSGWLVNSEELGGKAYELEIVPNQQRPADVMMVSWRARPEGCVRQVHITSTITR